MTLLKTLFYIMFFSLNIYLDLNRITNQHKKKLTIPFNPDFFILLVVNIFQILPKYRA